MRGPRLGMVKHILSGVHMTNESNRVRVNAKWHTANSL